MHHTDFSTPPDGPPPLDAAATAHRQAVENALIRRIEAAPGRSIPFEQWMNLALYAPGLGYYAAGSEKLGSAAAQGDFITAPEISPLFGQTLARQIAQVLGACGSVNVLEFGAGSGALAASIIPALRALGIEPTYRILEISPDLRARQQQKLAALGSAVQWLDALPGAFTGCVLANEVLDAMPATLFRWADDGTVLELGVGVRDARADDTPVGTNQAASHHASPFVLTEHPASRDLRQAIAQRMPCLPGYQSEINRQAEAWVREMGGWLRHGAALLIDYGFPQREYYHPQRTQGTLMCHFRHHAHAQPLVLAGLQDITTHVDFTAMADAALAGGLDVMGFTSQARFLINAGLADVIEHAQRDTAQAREGYAGLAGVQQLISEAEMGELFKVLALGRGLDIGLTGFSTGDRRHRL
jgi:SAM-dependent MidA family methyltransferase